MTTNVTKLKSAFWTSFSLVRTRIVSIASLGPDNVFYKYRFVKTFILEERYDFPHLFPIIEILAPKLAKVLKLMCLQNWKESACAKKFRQESVN